MGFTGRKGIPPKCPELGTSSSIAFTGDSFNVQVKAGRRVRETQGQGCRTFFKNL